MPGGGGQDGRRAVGAAGESAVAAWYEARGYRVLDRNWRVREGEIDLVVGRERAVVFCEVKTRRSAAFGAPVEAVTGRKQQRIRRLARRWLLERSTGRGYDDVRFDVASVVPDGRGWVVEVVEGAF